MQPGTEELATPEANVSQAKKYISRPDKRFVDQLLASTPEVALLKLCHYGTPLNSKQMYLLLKNIKQGERWRLVLQTAVNDFPDEVFPVTLPAMLGQYLIDAFGTLLTQAVDDKKAKPRLWTLMGATPGSAKGLLAFLGPSPSRLVIEASNWAAGQPGVEISAVVFDGLIMTALEPPVDQDEKAPEPKKIADAAE